MEHGVSFDDICRHFEDDHGAKWTASILHLEETPSDPVSCVLKSSLDAPEKLAMLQILLDGKTWIEECLLLLKQIAAAIEPILTNIILFTHTVILWFPPKTARNPASQNGNDAPTGHLHPPLSFPL